MTQEARSCFHCGEPVAGKNWPATTPDGTVDSCCIGCKTVTETIYKMGFDDYYLLRDQPAAKADTLNNDALLSFLENEENRQSVISSVNDQLDRAQLFIEDIRCAACVWLLEKTLSSLDGIARVSVNLSQRTASIQWHRDQIDLADILMRIQSLGYVAQPLTHSQLQDEISRTNRKQLWRVGIAGLFTMQTMMLSTGLYAGAFHGIDVSHQLFLRLISAALTLPVLFYSGLPILRSGFRAIAHRSVNMDVPVSAALLIAFGFSLTSTATNGEHVYFDTACMFVFFLSLSRLVQTSIDLKSHTALHQLVRQFDQSVTRINGAETQPVSLNQIQSGDRVLIRSGDTIPVDGTIESGSGEIDESVLNGEFAPVHKNVGDTVFAGSTSHAQPLTIAVLRPASQSRLAALDQMSLDVLNNKPRIVQLANRTATWFSTALIVIATGTGFFWWATQPAQAIEITLSVLIITCPCALALAIPSAISASLKNTLSSGLLITDTQAIETLPKVTDVVIDKTGTLTEGTFQIEHIDTYSNVSSDTARTMAAAIERGSTHPIAHTFAPFATPELTATDIKHFDHALSGTINSERVLFGEYEALKDSVNESPPDFIPSHAKQLFLATQSNWLAHFTLDDNIRQGAAELVHYCDEHRITLHLLSGDEPTRVNAAADQLGIAVRHARLSAENKLHTIQRLQQNNKVVLAVGDGLNDAPILAAADIGFAMGSGSDLSRTRAGGVVLNDKLQVIKHAFECAQKTRQIIRQNLAWAIGYNTIALPFAIVGAIPPWLAAIGMSTSSLIVTLNSMRLINFNQNSTKNLTTPTLSPAIAES